MSKENRLKGELQKLRIAIEQHHNTASVFEGEPNGDGLAQLEKLDRLITQIEDNIIAISLSED